MKRANKLFDHIADPENLRLAYWKAAIGKRYASEVLAYGKQLDANLRLLRAQLLSGQVEVGDYRFFKVYEPKERQICASAFREQVLHHALMNICHEHFERVQIFDSYASRKGKGSYAALTRARKFAQAHPWFLKLDVRKFFESVHHPVVKEQLARMFKEPALLDVFGQIIDSYQAHPARGLPIGNLTSQYFANHYLVGLDHFIQEKLRPGAYVRYMDDMVLWHADKQALKTAFHAIRDYVETRLHCQLKPELLNRCTLGLPFLGYRIFPHQLRLTHSSKIRFVRKMQQIEANYHEGIWDENECQRRACALLAFISHADTALFRKSLYLPHKGLSS